MADEVLRCGCGGEVKIGYGESDFKGKTQHGHQEFLFKCKICPFEGIIVLEVTDVKQLYEKPLLEQAIAAFKKATRYDQQSIQWISIKERLPENIRDVLTCNKEHQVTCNIGFFGDGIWKLYKGIGNEVDYWAEINLPEVKE